MKYLQRNSKRKQKSRAKRLAREICDSFKYHSERVQEGGALSPEEFLRLEAIERPMAVEPSMLSRSDTYYGERALTASFKG